jgi:hypothetical protein
MQRRAIRSSLYKWPPEVGTILATFRIHVRWDRTFLSHMDPISLQFLVDSWVLMGIVERHRVRRSAHASATNVTNRDHP